METDMERTLVLIKPDAISRGLMGRLISRFEDKGLQIVGCKMMQLDDRILAEHYSHLFDKPFFPRIAAFMKSTPVVALCVQGLEAVEVVRKMCGVTNSRAADPGTIRGDLGMSIQCNLVHASDGADTARLEVARFFKAEELFDFTTLNRPVIYADDEV
jgi:nucleoside-diphosphate kinase